MALQLTPTEFDSIKQEQDTFLQTLEGKLGAESDIKIKFGRKIAVGIVSNGERRRELSSEQLTDLVEALNQPADSNSKPYKNGRAIPDIEISAGDTVLFRQERDGTVTVNEIQPEIVAAPEIALQSEALESKQPKSARSNAAVFPLSAEQLYALADLGDRVASGEMTQEEALAAITNARPQTEQAVAGDRSQPFTQSESQKAVAGGRAQPFTQSESQKAVAGERAQPSTQSTSERLEPTTVERRDPLAVYSDRDVQLFNQILESTPGADAESTLERRELIEMFVETSDIYQNAKDADKQQAIDELVEYADEILSSSERGINKAATPAPDVSSSTLTIDINSSPKIEAWEPELKQSPPEIARQRESETEPTLAISDEVIHQQGNIYSPPARRDRAAQTTDISEEGNIDSPPARRDRAAQTTDISEEELTTATGEPPEIETIEFDSSAIKAAGYDAKSRILRLEDSSGDRYDYRHVEPELWENLQQVENVDKFFNTYVKGYYDFTRAGVVLTEPNLAFYKFDVPNEYAEIESQYNESIDGLKDFLTEDYPFKSQLKEAYQLNRINEVDFEELNSAINEAIENDYAPNSEGRLSELLLDNERAGEIVTDGMLAELNREAYEEVIASLESKASVSVTVNEAESEKAETDSAVTKAPPAQLESSERKTIEEAAKYFGAIALPPSLQPQQRPTLQQLVFAEIGTGSVEPASSQLQVIEAAQTLADPLWEGVRAGRVQRESLGDYDIWRSDKAIAVTRNNALIAAAQKQPDGSLVLFDSKEGAFEKANQLGFEKLPTAVPTPEQIEEASWQLAQRHPAPAQKIESKTFDYPEENGISAFDVLGREMAALEGKVTPQTKNWWQQVSANMKQEFEQVRETVGRSREWVTAAAVEVKDNSQGIKNFWEKTLQIAREAKDSEVAQRAGQQLKDVGQSAWKWLESRPGAIASGQLAKAAFEKFEEGHSRTYEKSYQVGDYEISRQGQNLYSVTTESGDPVIVFKAQKSLIPGRGHSFKILDSVARTSDRYAKAFEQFRKAGTPVIGSPDKEADYRERVGQVADALKQTLERTGQEALQTEKFQVFDSNSEGIQIRSALTQKNLLGNEFESTRLNRSDLKELSLLADRANQQQDWVEDVAPYLVDILNERKTTHYEGTNRTLDFAPQDNRLKLTDNATGTVVVDAQWNPQGQKWQDRGSHLTQSDRNHILQAIRGQQTAKTQRAKAEVER